MADVPTIDALLVHEGLVRGVARAVLRGDDRVEDVVQDTWAKSMSTGPREAAATRGWLAQVARRFALLTLRRDGTRRKHASEIPPPPRIPSPDDILAREETRQRVVRALVAIPEPYRSALLLRYYEDLPPREIAKRLGLPVETARTHVKRGLDRLRAALAAERVNADRRSLAALAWWSSGSAGSAFLTTAAGKAVVAGAVAALLVGGGVAWRAGAADDRGSSESTPPAAEGATDEVPEPASEPTPASATPPTLRGAPPPRRDRAPPDRPVADLDVPAPETPPDVPPVVAGAPQDDPSERLPRVPDPADVRPAEPTSLARGVGAFDEPPPGMVWVRPGKGVIGSTPAEIARVAAGRRDALEELVWETDAHEFQHTGYFLGRCEVTNAQYAVFLESSRVTHRVGEQGLSTLREIATHFVHGGDAKAGAADATSWRTIYEANRRALSTGSSAEAPDSLADRALPSGLELVVATRPFPASFVAGKPARGEEDHPVRSVSYDDAAAFADWAGWHVPTEEEWEHAARFPDGRTHPWGFEWADGDDRVLWSRNVRPGRGNEPSPEAVDARPNGASALGLHHMLGNVAEWTSSWVLPYPGADVDARNPVRALGYEGRGFARVLRGGSLADAERLVLRLPARNLRGTGREGPSRPQNRFPFVGFRCAAYPQPGRDRLERVIDALDAGGWLKDETHPIARTRFAGAATSSWTTDPRPKDHVYATGRSFAIVFAPRDTVFALDERPTARSAQQLLNHAQEAPHVLGVLHVDVGLERLDLPLAGSGRGTPRTRLGSLPPGSYLVGVQHGRVGLFHRSLDLAAFLRGAHVADVRLSELARFPPSTLEVDAARNAITSCAFAMPFGGRRPNGEGIAVTFHLDTEPGALARAGTWRSASRPAPK